jgi:hypothetical protein
MLGNKIGNLVVSVKSVDCWLMDVTANNDPSIAGRQAKARTFGVCDIAPFFRSRRISVDIKPIFFGDAQGKTIEESALIYAELAACPFGRFGRTGVHIAIKIAGHVVVIAFNRNATMSADSLDNR